ncbi:MAG: hydroxymethylbilane synthase [Cyclobacteriaceae bacterium]
MKLKIGTRGSKLALWQAEHVAERLQLGGIETELTTIETRGDKKLDVTIAEIGTKGVFTEEIEHQLSEGTIDIAVHSAKDMQSELPEQFELIAFTEREKVNDVLVSHDKSIDLSDNSKKWVIGTSSARRKAMLKHFYPHIKTVEMRGNLQTRIAKMEAGQCHAMLLAYAGVHRMGYHDMIAHEFDVSHFIPAVGQGSIAIESLREMASDKKEAVRRLINHPLTESRLIAERAFLRKLRGGCSIPVFALAELENKQINLRGGIISLDGKEIVKEHICGPVSAAKILGEKLAESILSQGGDRILSDIRKHMDK